MTIPIFLLLLAAAVMHAGWNALVKRDSDRQAAAIAVAAGGAVLSAAAIPLLPPMTARASPFIIGTALTHILYFTLIARAYAGSDLSVAYPLMRGSAPLIVTLAGAVLFAELPRPVSLGGVVLLSLGIIVLGLDGIAGGRAGRAGVTAALLNGAVIASYTLIDGTGVRISGAALTYIAWTMLASGLVNTGFYLLRARRLAFSALRDRVPLGLAGGAISIGSYGIALWAMTRAPIGVVAAIRESSVLFAAGIGALFLGERFGALRWLAAAMVAAGLAAIKVGAA
jgi:drug/metabolite transporter (DMT)-like permease